MARNAFVQDIIIKPAHAVKTATRIFITSYKMYLPTDNTDTKLFKMLVIIYNHFQISEIKIIKRKTTFYSVFFYK